jgi:integrase/recombinase XerC
VTDRWRREDDRTDQTIQRMSEIADRFASRLSVQQIFDLYRVGPDECEGFINAHTRTGEFPSVGTRHFRRVTLRALFRTLRADGIDIGDPTLDIELPPRSPLATRPLTIDEVILCRTASFAVRTPDLRRPSAWALAEATASTAEIPHIRGVDVKGLMVTLPGSSRTRPRRFSLTMWGQAIIERRIRELGDPTLPLTYDGEGAPGEVSPQAASCKLIGSILDVAGLGREPDIRPASVRYWRARAVYDLNRDVTGAARVLGMNSLDRAAEAIGLEWKEAA